MANDGIIPVMDMNPYGNRNCDGWGGNGWGAAVGGAIGAWAGSAWNGNRWGNGPAGSATAFGETFIMDSLTGARSDINAIGRDQMLQTAGIQSSLCQGFSGVTAAVNTAAGQIANGQTRTEAAVLTTGLQGQIQQKDNTIFQLNAAHSAEVQGMRNTFDLKSAISDCCCTTNRNIEQQGCQTRATIMAEGAATRELINKIERDALLRENCADKAKIAQLESQQFCTKVAQESVVATQNTMGQMLNTILSHMPKQTASTSTASTATAPAASQS